MNNKDRQRPSRFAEALLRTLLPVREQQDLLGDYAESFRDIADHKGRFVARLWYWMQILSFVPRSVLNSIKWGLVMIRNYLKITFRTIHRNKMVSFINLFGLALGMACFMLIMLWVQDELSYDSFHANADHLYRVIEEQTFGGNTGHVARTPAALAPALAEELPEVVHAVRYMQAPSLLFAHGTKRFYENHVAFANPSILDMFTFPILEGNPESTLHDVSSVVITEKMAEKYFGDQNPIHKTITINDKYDFVVSAVIRNVPANSHLRFDFILPFSALETMGTDVGIRWPGALENWGINFIFTYIQAAESVDRALIEEKILNAIQEHSGVEGIKLYLQPIRDIHLHSNLIADFENNGDITYVTIFSAIGFLILLIACINFTNLTTTQSGKRSKEVGMRKISGANRTRIVHQFLGESLLLTILAFLVSVLLVIVFLPTLNQLSGKHITFNILGNARMLIGLLVILLGTGFLSGIYPAFILSAFRPVAALKGSVKTGPKNKRFRSVLVIFQFCISIAMIIATLVVHRQLDYIRNSKLGFEREHVIWLRLRGDTSQSYRALKNELLRNANIRGVTAADQLPTQIMYTWTGAYWPGKDPDDPGLMNAISVDFDFIETMHINMTEGRSFSDAVRSDRTDAFILNRKAANVMGKENPVGEPFGFIGRRGYVIGIIDDFQFETFYHDVKPLVMMHSDPESDYYLMIRLGEGNVAGHLRFIEETWDRLIPKYPFEYQFLDEHFDLQYRKEQRMETLFDYFSILALCIAFLGLFGLVTFETERRTKEIGIRKTLGASSVRIALLLIKELFALVMVANFLAWPIAYLLMNKWLLSFARRTELGIWVFILSGLIAFSLAIITLTYRTIKAASSNPIKALRYE